MLPTPHRTPTTKTKRGPGRRGPGRRGGAGLAGPAPCQREAPAGRAAESALQRARARAAPGGRSPLQDTGQVQVEAILLVSPFVPADDLFDDGGHVWEPGAAEEPRGQAGQRRRRQGAQGSGLGRGGSPEPRGGGGRGALDGGAGGRPARLSPRPAGGRAPGQRRAPLPLLLLLRLPAAAAAAPSPRGPGRSGSGGRARGGGGGRGGVQRAAESRAAPPPPPSLRRVRRRRGEAPSSAPRPRNGDSGRAPLPPGAAAAPRSGPRTGGRGAGDRRPSPARGRWETQSSALKTWAARGAPAGPVSWLRPPRARQLRAPQASIMAAAPRRDRPPNSFAPLAPPPPPPPQSSPATSSLRGRPPPRRAAPPAPLLAAGPYAVGLGRCGARIESSPEGSVGGHRSRPQAGGGILSLPTRNYFLGSRGPPCPLRAPSPDWGGARPWPGAAGGGSRGGAGCGARPVQGEL